MKRIFLASMATYFALLRQLHAHIGYKSAADADQKKTLLLKGFSS